MLSRASALKSPPFPTCPFCKCLLETLPLPSPPRHYNEQPKRQTEQNTEVPFCLLNGVSRALPGFQNMKFRDDGARNFKFQCHRKDQRWLQVLLGGRVGHVHKHVTWPQQSHSQREPLRWCPSLMFAPSEHEALLLHPPSFDQG